MTFYLTETSKRPLGVWVLSILYIIFTFGSFLSFYFLIGTQEHPRESMLEVSSHTLRISVLLFHLIKLSGAILLFFLRRKALYFLGVAFLGSIPLSIWKQTLVYGTYYDPITWIVLMFGWIPSFAFLIYVIILAKKGVLK